MKESLYVLVVCSPSNLAGVWAGGSAKFEVIRGVSHL